MAAGKWEGPAQTDSDDESLPKAVSDHTPLRGNRKREDSSCRKTFGVFDAALVLVSLVAYLVDSLTDILVSVEYFQAGHYAWAGITLGLVAGPSIAIQGFSLRWYKEDGKVKGCRPWLVHIFQLQPLERYLCVLLAGVDARSTTDPDALQSYYYQQNDVCMLRLFEAFLESAPQLTLQLYIMVATSDAGWLTGFSACVSLVALGWAVAIYNHALRQAHRDDYQLQWSGLFLQTIWHIGTVAARVCALVAFASLYKGWLFLFIGLHWILMTVWVVLQRTDFCPTKLEERLFNAVVGVIYCYCFFSLKEGQTRWRMAVFYTIMFVENVVLIAVWYPFRKEDDWTSEAIIGVAFGGFFLGVLCMLVYYRFCHPSGPIYCLNPSTDDDSPEGLKRKTSTIHQLQVDLVPRTSTALLPRRAHLKPQTSLAMAALPVEFKEIYTPSQLTPIKAQPGCRRVIDYNQTFELDNTSLFQHYSIEASQCMFVSQCATLNFEGVDLTQACGTERTERTERALMRSRLPEVQEAHSNDGKSPATSDASRQTEQHCDVNLKLGFNSSSESLDEKTTIRWKQSPQYYSPPSFDSRSTGTSQSITPEARVNETSIFHICTPDKWSSFSPIQTTDDVCSYEVDTDTPVMPGRLQHPDIIPTLMSTPYPLGMEMCQPNSRSSYPSGVGDLGIKMAGHDSTANISIGKMDGENTANTSDSKTEGEENTANISDSKIDRQENTGNAVVCDCGADDCLVCNGASNVSIHDLTLSLRAPLAEPEMTWSESLCEVSLNESLYDNMSEHGPVDASLNGMLSGVSGLTFNSQGPRTIACRV